MGKRFIRHKRASGFTPSPLAASWWGPLADKLWRGLTGKPAMYPSPLITDRKRPPRTGKEKCPCVALRVCDLKWRAMSKEEQDKWNAAVKKPHMIGYQLYMKECIALLSKQQNFPDCPSVSGGFSCHYVEPGETPPDEIIGKAPPPDFPIPPAGVDCWNLWPTTPAWVYLEIYDLPPAWGIAEGIRRLNQHDANPCYWTDSEPLIAPYFDYWFFQWDRTPYARYWHTCGGLQLWRNFAGPPPPWGDGWCSRIHDYSGCEGWIELCPPPANPPVPYPKARTFTDISQPPFLEGHEY